MIRKPIARKKAIVLGVLAVVILLAGYTLLSYYKHLENPTDRSLPTWSQMGEGFLKSLEYDDMERGRWLILDAKATGLRLLLGVLGGTLLGVLLGIYMGAYSKVESLFLPPLSLMKQLPPTAAMGVFFALFGVGLKMYSAMIIFGIAPIIALTVYLAFKEAAEELLQKAYTLGASDGEATWSIIFRQIEPKIVDIFRLQIGPALVYLIAAEMVLADVGFGYRIRLEFKKVNMDVVYPYLMLLASFGFGLDWIIKFCQRIRYRWNANGGN